MIEIPQPKPVDPAEAERRRKEEKRQREEAEAWHQKWLEEQEEIRREKEKRKTGTSGSLEAHEPQRESAACSVDHQSGPTAALPDAVALQPAVKRREEIWQDLNDSREFGFGLKMMRTVVAPFEKLSAKWIPVIAWKVISGLFAILAFSTSWRWVALCGWLCLLL